MDRWPESEVACLRQSRLDNHAGYVFVNDRVAGRLTGGGLSLRAYSGTPGG
jgi:hypothetical protein